MPAQIIDGVALAAQVREQIRGRVSALRAKNKPVKLVALLVGGTPAGEIYADKQRSTCGEVGIDYELLKLPTDTSFDSLATKIETLNNDPTVTGVMIHLPLPAHIEPTRIQARIDAVKDVEGVSPANIGYCIYGKEIIVPCTALASLELIRSTGYRLEGVDAVVVGASAIVGRPAALLLTQAGATVTICQKLTRDLKSHTRRADVLIVAAGVPNLIAANHIREGAVVIDVGINRVTTLDGTTKIVGDVNFEDVVQKAAYLSPVPGGVGPMTVAMLLQNTVRAAELLAG
ncbi:MAG: bifunctional 5,10-methylenetetrahydrofolate dehydrogenase/5,10-methenyltetrahydrofolate cyclohydrolase [Tepidisphaeraceae bacterium]